ncbi:MAG: hypothetical protein ACXWTP_02650 [Methylosarcina sp.]
MKKKLPPFGRELKSRLEFNNPPFMAVVCAGKDAWNNAKKWNNREDYAAMVLPPGKDPASLIWPVRGLICLLEWNAGPSKNLIIAIIKTLLKAGANSVVVRPLFVNHKDPAYRYDTSKPIGERWMQQREMIRVYHNPACNMEVQNAA